VVETKQKGDIEMNDSVKKWINGKSDSCTFTVDKVSTGHKAHRGGVGIHDTRPRRQRTRGAAQRNAMRD
jgi:hypothetical protein